MTLDLQEVVSAPVTLDGQRRSFREQLPGDTSLNSDIDFGGICRGLACILQAYDRVSKGNSISPAGVDQSVEQLLKEIVLPRTQLTDASEERPLYRKVLKKCKLSDIEEIKAFSKFMTATQGLWRSLIEGADQRALLEKQMREPTKEQRERFAAFSQKLACGLYRAHKRNDRESIYAYGIARAIISEFGEKSPENTVISIAEGLFRGALAQAALMRLFDEDNTLGRDFDVRVPDPDISADMRELELKGVDIVVYDRTAKVVYLIDAKGKRKSSEHVRVVHKAVPTSTHDYLKENMEIPDGVPIIAVNVEVFTDSHFMEIGSVREEYKATTLGNIIHQISLIQSEYEKVA